MCNIAIIKHPTTTQHVTTLPCEILKKTTILYALGKYLAENVKRPDRDRQSATVGSSMSQ